MSLSWKSCLAVLVRIFLGGMFIYAAVPKIGDPFGFAVDVYNYRMLPDFAVGIVAAGLPWLELIVGACLVLGIRVRTTALLSMGMLGVFTLALFINTLRGINVDCGCFTADRSIGWRAVMEDMVFLLLSFWCFLSADTTGWVERVLLKK